MEGEQGSQQLPGQETALIISEAVQDLWDRHGLSSEYLDDCKAREQRALMPLAEAGPSLPVAARDFALRSMAAITSAKRMSLQSWFQAVSLLDTYLLRTTGSIEMLPATCVCLVRLLRKADCSVTNDESSTWLPFTQQMAGRLAVPGFQVPEITEDILSRHELMICQALDWHLNPVTVSQWISMFCKRFNLLSSSNYQARLALVEHQALSFARVLVVREAPSMQSSPFDLALGMFSLCLVRAQLIPLSTLCSPGITLSEMHVAYMQSQSSETIPVCALTDEQAFAVLDMAQVVACSKLDMLQQAAQSVVQSLAAQMGDIKRMHRTLTA